MSEPGVMTSKSGVRPSANPAGHPGVSARPGNGRSHSLLGEIYAEPRKVADILAGEPLPLSSRVALVQSGQGVLEIGTVLVAADNDIYFVAGAGNVNANTRFAGVLGERIDTGPSVPADQVTGTVFETASL